MSDAIKRIRERIDALLKTASELKAGQRENGFGFPILDGDRYTSWRMSALTVIRSLTPGSHFETEFNDIDEKLNLGQPWKLGQQSGILSALREDLDCGLLMNIRGLLRAEVLASFLDQADHLLNEGYWQSSAVIIGAVLEDHLRKLCAKHPAIALHATARLAAMNAELAKAGEYDALVQRQIAVWADIHDKAAHGHWTELSSDDVRDLLRSARHFLVEHPD
jgi:hypothetical protein